MLKVSKNSNVIILDSNFILLPVQFQIDYIEEITYSLEGKNYFLVYQQVFDELKAKEDRLKKEGKDNKFHTQFEAGKRYLRTKQNEFEIEVLDEVKKENETTDEFLLRKAKSLKSKHSRIFLATNDYNLRKKAKRLEISVIYLRQKQFISISRA